MFFLSGLRGNRFQNRVEIYQLVTFCGCIFPVFTNKTQYCTCMLADIKFPCEKEFFCLALKIKMKYRAAVVSQRCF